MAGPRFGLLNFRARPVQSSPRHIGFHPSFAAFFFPCFASNFAPLLRLSTQAATSSRYPLSTVQRHCPDAMHDNDLLTGCCSCKGVRLLLQTLSAKVVCGCMLAQGSCTTVLEWIAFGSAEHYLFKPLEKISWAKQYWAVSMHS